jgi:molybdate transport system substrate-binding protein
VTLCPELFSNSGTSSITTPFIAAGNSAFISLGDTSGIYTAAMIERLGIEAEMKPKTKLVAAGSKGETVAKGEAEIGFDQVSNIVANEKIESLGPLPAALQSYTRYAGGTVAGSKQQDAGKAFVAFLRSPAAQAVMKQKGFEAP